MSQKETKMLVVLLIALVVSLAWSFFMSPMILCDVWRWNVVSLGVPQIKHWQAFGLLVGFHMLLPTGTLVRLNKSLAKDDDSVTSLKTAASVCLTELVTWGLAWLAS